MKDYRQFSYLIIITMAAVVILALTAYKSDQNAQRLAQFRERDLKKKTADTVLMEIGGHRAPTRIDSRNLNVTANAEDIEEFKRRGIEAAKAAGLLTFVENEGERKRVASSDEDLEID